MLKSTRVGRASQPRVAGLYCLLHNSCLLASDSLAGGVLAFTAMVAVSGDRASLDCWMDRHCTDLSSLAAARAIPYGLALDASNRVVHSWVLDLSESGTELQ